MVYPETVHISGLEKTADIYNLGTKEIHIRYINSRPFSFQHCERIAGSLFHIKYSESIYVSHILSHKQQDSHHLFLIISWFWTSRLEPNPRHRWWSLCKYSLRHHIREGSSGLVIIQKHCLAQTLLSCQACWFWRAHLTSWWALLSQ